MTNMTNVSEKISESAVIMRLYSKCWSGARVLPKEVMEKIGDSSWLKGRKHLVAKELLDPIHAAQTQSRRALNGVSLPFPIISLHLIPKRLLPEIEARMIECQKAYWDAVDNFMAGYWPARAVAKESLGEYFSDEDYPVDINNKFGFEWNYLQLASPAEVTGVDFDIMKREQDKFEAMMADARDMAVEALRDEFSEMVKSCVDRIKEGDRNGGGSLKRSKVLSKLREFFDTFKDRNIFSDRVLETVVKDVEKIVGSFDERSLAENLKIRAEVQSQMERIQSEIENEIKIPVRKIRLAS